MFLLQPGPTPPHGGGSGFVKTRGGLAFLITGQSTAAIDSPSIDPVSVWLQNLSTSCQMTLLSILGLLLFFFSIYLFTWLLRVLVAARGIFGVL